MPSEGLRVRLIINSESFSPGLVFGVVVELCEDVSAKGFVLLLTFECCFVLGSLLLGEGLDSSYCVCKNTAHSSLLIGWFACKRVTDCTGVLGTITDCEIGVAVSADLA